MKIEKGNNEEEKEKMCKELGGTSNKTLLFGLMIEIVVSLTIIGVTSMLEDKSILNNKQAEKNTSTKTNNTYDGVLMYNTSINMNDEFIIKVPNKFENQSSSYDYNYAYSTEAGIFNKCSITLNSPEGYTSAENLIGQLANYNMTSNPSKVQKEKINNIEWYYFYYQNEFGLTYYYGTNKNNNVYLLEYQIEEEAEQDCITYKDTIINSIKSK